MASGKILDLLIIGGGHNGLVCAFYAARAGLSVRVIEKNDIVGGAAITEEFHPGFRNSVAAYTVSLLNPKIIADMQLARHGLRIVKRKALNFLPLPDGGHLLNGPGRTQATIADRNEKDGRAYPAYAAELDRVSDILRELVLVRPPNLVEGGLHRVLPELLRTAGLGRRLARLDAFGRQNFLDLLTRSAGDYLDGWFEDEAVKALLGFDAIVGNFASPFQPGSAYVLLHHVFGDVDGERGLWGHAIGGMGAITQAMAKAAGGAGAAIETGVAVEKVLIDGTRPVGVRLAGGREIIANRIASNLNPKLLFTRLVEGAPLPPAFDRRMKTWRNGSGSFRMNLALSRLPDFTALPGDGDHLTAGILIGPSLAYMDKAWRDAVAKGWSEKPAIEMLIPSTLDDSLAPKGAHVASLFCQHVNPTLPAGTDWEAARETIAQLMIKTVDAYAPGFAESVAGIQALGPLDLERRFGLLGGDIFHGAMGLDQLFSARPALGYADYRTPISGLYQCGS
ncbi:MAG: NAD(P)/FAD-dependent oxidoreductase, partial [Cucumibacter sp.]